MGMRDQKTVSSGILTTAKGLLALLALAAVIGAFVGIVGGICSLAFGLIANAL